MIDTFAALGLTVLERGWLSSNNIVFGAAPGVAATVVDTGYDSHAGQTLSLLAAHLGAEPLGRVVNTHLHSDHCGGNAALATAWACEVWVPEASFDAVRRWDESALTFAATGQRCQRFPAHHAVAVGARLRLGRFDWDVIAAPGHDADALMFFQPDSRVLITADALWEERLAIIFPELAGDSGFDEALGALAVIERLAPRIVIPGHGRPFTDVARALAASRRRLAQFAADPARHRTYAERALTMFHMLEHRSRGRGDLVAWLATAPIFQRIGETPADHRTAQAGDVVEGLIHSGQLRLADDDTVHLA
jgi:glyoxylase-like metal-dependent hydrolase (beta-lactamase superfamily II)